MGDKTKSAFGVVHCGMLANDHVLSAKIHQNTYFCGVFFMLYFNAKFTF